MGSGRRLSQLEILAQSYGIQTEYWDLLRRHRIASPEVLLATLKMLGCPAEKPRDVSEALSMRQQALWRRVLEPVGAAWDGAPASLEFRFPASLSEEKAAVSLLEEKGRVREYAVRLKDLPTTAAISIGGVRYLKKRFSLSQRVPWGYHRIALELGGRFCESLLIAAPKKAYRETHSRSWGVFLPLYAHVSEKKGQSGNFTGLFSLLEWVDHHGGTTVATLPLFSVFLDECFEPSPYIPVSRLFWNELYLDPATLPELLRSPKARAILESGRYQKALREFQGTSYVDYRGQMRLKRNVLEHLAGSFFSNGSPVRRRRFQRFVAEHPQAEDYARFRAASEHYRKSWKGWPKIPREGLLKEGDYEKETMQYHLYTQWACHEQMGLLSEKFSRPHRGLYLDFPLGVNPGGYDLWRHRHLFATGASGGAPPDAFFTKGQDWGFSPLHPEAIREEGHRYFIACLRRSLAYANFLRLDHVMGLHRLFWIPEGMKPADGVYVRYPSEELYAILCLESCRSRSVIVGENLGTVPPEVNAAMDRHGLQKMFVVQYELQPDSPKGLPKIPANAVASLNTHDMPTFAAFWRGLDIGERVRLGLLNRKGARREAEKRRRLRRTLTDQLLRRGYLARGASSDFEVLKGLLRWLGSSAAGVLLLSLEDLWLETKPQNVPGTSRRLQNWRRKARRSFETWSASSAIIDLVREVNRLRRGEAKR
ncbi:MAG: 4-alpha-glucanotransferase [Candidatus Omnitrophota bacterium]